MDFRRQERGVADPRLDPVGDESISIGNVPHLHDVTTTMELLGQMGVQFIIDERMKIHVDPRETRNFLRAL